MEIIGNFLNCALLGGLASIAVACGSSHTVTGGMGGTGPLDASSGARSATGGGGGNAVGGASNTAGASTSGGASTMGGTSGKGATGGVPSTGGMTAIGGMSGTGGAAAGAGGAMGGAAGNAGAAGAGGAGNGLPCGVEPSGGVYAVFRVGTETFYALITNLTGIQQAIDLWQGRSTAQIPNGKLVCTSANYNCGYSWYLDPSSIQFADVTIELCDGTPSYVEANCASFGTNYCPWSAQLIELYDCRQAGCPPVPP